MTSSSKLISNLAQNQCFLTTLRFIPSCDYLILNDTLVIRVEDFKHLSTVLDSKLNFGF